MMNHEAIESELDYVFQDKRLVERALTHRSFAQQHNERLEFLGDAVLDCVIGKALFLREDHFDEGSLSRVRANLVCEESLYRLALELHLPEHLRMGEGERKTGGSARPSILADALEALFGAVFLEGGYEAVEHTILSVYEPVLSSLGPQTLAKDPKTCLQEFLQSRHLPRPVYTIVHTAGAAHERRFECACRIESLGIETTGRELSRRKAEREAALQAMKILEERFGSGEENGK